ncbi:MAG: hypothetical protein ACRDOI_44295 [Trebonia sp.]
MPGLQPGPGYAVGSLHRARMLPGPVLFPHPPQVEVILQELSHHLPAPIVQELFQLEGREPGHGRPGKLADKGAEQGPGGREGIIRQDRGVRCHRGLFFLKVRQG